MIDKTFNSLSKYVPDLSGNDFFYSKVKNYFKLEELIISLILETTYL
ncbi:MAG: hypothetical protein HRU03_02615 [Nanoarchaeales archaeon]|nr:hypothetical protein [Nanoarchaeales archaeon]